MGETLFRFLVVLCAIALAIVVFLFWVGESRRSLIEQGREYDCTFADPRQVRASVHACEARERSTKAGAGTCQLEAAAEHCQRIERRL